MLEGAYTEPTEIFVTVKKEKGSEKEIFSFKEKNWPGYEKLRAKRVEELKKKEDALLKNSKKNEVKNESSDSEGDDPEEIKPRPANTGQV